jgi:hypothetical protein
MNATQSSRSVLWLGAHKTGTTFLQEALDLSAAALEARGLSYMALDSFRDAYTRPLLYQGRQHPPQPPREGLNLVFDENIPALVQNVLSAEGLYPEIAPRSQRISDYLGLQDPDIYFGIRSYTGFLPSLFCETLKSTQYQPFVRFYLRGIHVLDWGDLVDRLRRAYPGSRITLYQYEELRGKETRLLSQITGVDLADFTIPGKPNRPGFSHKAVRSLYERHKTETLTSKDVFEAVRRFPKSRKFPPFDPWRRPERESLDALYASHLARLRQRDDVTFLTL